MNRWPALMGPFVAEVIDQDCVWSDKGTCFGCGALSGDQHAIECFQLGFRVDRRIGLAARLHLWGRHPLYLPADAVGRIANRDTIVSDLRAKSLFSVATFKKYVARYRADTHRFIVSSARFYHLDDGWDGQGIRPSRLAHLDDVIPRAWGNRA